MGFRSIFAWKALPEAVFVKKAVIDAHRSKHEDGHRARQAERRRTSVEDSDHYWRHSHRSQPVVGPSSEVPHGISGEPSPVCEIAITQFSGDTIIGSFTLSAPVEASEGVDG